MPYSPSQRLKARINRALSWLEQLAEHWAPHGDINNPGLTQEGNWTLKQVHAAMAELKGEEHELPETRETRFSKIGGFDVESTTPEVRTGRAAEEEDEPHG